MKENAMKLKKMTEFNKMAETEDLKNMRKEIEEIKAKELRMVQ
jgi:hypothetical protein